MTDRNTPVLVGSRDIGPYDFILQDDACSFLEDSNERCYALTANTDVDALFGTHVETDENGDTLEFLFTASEDLTACNPSLTVLLNREDTGAQEEYVHPLTLSEAQALLQLCREHEIDRLRRLIKKGSAELIQDDGAAWRT